MTSANKRLYYMDNLRALAMLLGIFFHAAIAYNPMMSNLWLASGPEQSVLLEQIAWFTHLFRMPLFFLIAGFFAYFLMTRRGVKAFLIHRLKRIGVPFIVFTPLVVISVFVSVGWAMEAVQNPSPMLGAIKWMAANPEQAPETPFSTMHMWFLFNLMLFCLVAALLFARNVFDSKIVMSLANPWVMIIIFPLLMVPALVSVPSPHPAAEKLYPEAWSFGFYGLFFFLGLVIYKAENVIENLKPFALPLLVLSIGLYIVLFPMFPKAITFQDAMMMANGPAFDMQHLLVATLEAYIAVFMTIVCLVYGAKLLDIHSKAMRYVADASYWIYIIHLPVLFVIQFHLLDVEWGLWTEFLVSSFGTLLIGFITYAALVRWTPIGILLNGRRVPLSNKTKETETLKAY